MASDNRTLKLSILADVDDLKKKLGDADKSVEINANKMSEFGKKAAAAFAIAAAAAVAYAGKLAIDGVKSALEDEQAQLRLANALRTATGATDGQIQATEDYISKTALAVGIADDDLRPAFQRLAVSTKSTTEAQRLLTLAIDVSKGSGKDLETVVNALGKAQDGNTTSLGRLGVGLSKTELSTLSFTQIQEKLSDLYGGAASRNAETFQGRIDRLKVGFDEAKEAVGVALLPIIEKLIGYIFEYGVPIVEKFQAAWDIIQGAIERNRKSFEEFGQVLITVVFPIVQKVFGFMFDIGVKAASAIIDAFGAIVGAVTPVLNFIIDAINTVIRGLNRVKPGSDIQELGKIGSAGGAMTGGYQTGAGVSGASAGGRLNQERLDAAFVESYNASRAAAGVGSGGTGVMGATGALDLVKRLTSVNDAFTDLTFQVQTNGITQKAAEQQFKKLTQEFAVLETQASSLTRTQDSRDLAAAQSGGSPYNITINTISSHGVAQAVSQALNESAARSTPTLNYQTIREKAG
jgi:hypothetical protein